MRQEKSQCHSYGLIHRLAYTPCIYCRFRNGGLIHRWAYTRGGLIHKILLYVGK